MRRARIFVLVLISASAALVAQTPAEPTFEVASVKPNVSGEDRWSFALGGPRPPGAPALGPPDMVTITNAPLRMIIVQAYNIPFVLERFILLGGQEKVLNARFDVRAKPPEGTPVDQMRPMLKTLLADRFKLRLHIEKRQIPVFAITVAREGRLGPEIRESRWDCDALFKAGRKVTDPDSPLDSKGRGLCWSNYDFGATMGVRYAGPMSMLVSRAQSFVDRPVVDATGLTGNYEWQLTFTMRDTPDAVAPSIYTAFQEQLGLKLEPRTGPFEVFVIDSVEVPTPD